MLRTILVPLDGSPLAERALPYAAELARVAGAQLNLVRAAWALHRLHLRRPDARAAAAADYLRGQAERLRRDGLVVDTAVAPGKPAEGLLAEIERRQPASGPDATCPTSRVPSRPTSSPTGARTRVGWMPTLAGRRSS